MITLRSFGLALLAASASSLVACSGDETSPGAAGTGAGPAETAVARFALPESGAPPFLEVPFPTDLYRDASGRVAGLPGIEAWLPKGGEYLAAALSSADGYGTTAGAMFRIDDLGATDDSGGPAALILDRASLPASEEETLSPAASVLLVDLDVGDGASALVPSRVDYRDDRGLGSNLRPLLVVYPARGVALREGARYAAVVTTGVRAEDGRPVAPSPTFRAIASGERRATEAESAYGEAVDRVLALVPDRGAEEIAALALYTTHDVTHELIDLRASIDALPAPQLSWDAADLLPMGPGLFARAPLPAGYTATLDAWLGAPADGAGGVDDPANDQATGKAHDAIAAIGTAVFEAPSYLTEAGAYDDPTHRNFTRDAEGRIVQDPARPTSRIWVTFALPEGPPPPAGFPAVIVQHGLGSDRSFMLAMANTFAAKGWATVAIESVTFGARAASAGLTIDAESGFAWSDEAGAYDGPDGFVDERNGLIDFFGGLQNLGAPRDQMRQSILDIGVLVGVLRDPALDLGPLALAVSGAKIDAARLAYVGDSLGGIMGALVAAVDPHLETFVLNVPGAGFITELTSGPFLGLQLGLAGTVNFGVLKARFAPAHPLMQLLQHCLDPGDPLLYAHHIVTDPAAPGGVPNARKSVLQIQVIADETVSNESTEALARAAGFPLAEPSTGSRTGVPLASAAPIAGEISGVPEAGVTAVMIQAGPATHGGDLYNRVGHHNYVYPWGQFDEDKPFQQLPDSFAIDQPYLALQSTMVRFLETAFSGGPPIVSGFPAPLLDFDADGALDGDDAAPSDPGVQ